MPKISVVVPIYAVEAFLPRCVDSLLAQTFSDFELILVDDGSPDNCGAICDAYAQKDSRVKVIHQKNGGLSAARNAGMAEATGKYLYFLDSDDYLAENTFETLYTTAEKDKLDIVFFSAQCVFEGGQSRAEQAGYESYYSRSPLEKPVVSGTELAEIYIRTSEFRSNVALQFYRRGLITENHFTFFKGIYHEDEQFSTLILLKAQRVGVCTEKLHYRVFREGSIMTSAKSSKHFEGLFISFARINAEALTLPADAVIQRAFLTGRANECLFAASKIYYALPAKERERAMVDCPRAYHLLYREMFYNSAYSFLPKKLLAFAHGIRKFGWGFPFVRIAQLLHLKK